MFSLSHARDKTNYIFFYFFTELKTYHLSYSIYKHDAEHDDIHDADAIDIVDLSSMQDAYRTNFVIHLAHRRVCVLRFDSSGGFRFFFFVPRS